MELGGTVKIICEKTGYHTELEFRLKVHRFLYCLLSHFSRILKTVYLNWKVHIVPELFHWDCGIRWIAWFGYFSDCTSCPLLEIHIFYIKHGRYTKGMSESRSKNLRWGSAPFASYRVHAIRHTPPWLQIYYFVLAILEKEWWKQPYCWKNQDG